MKHLLLIVSMAITCTLAAVANLLISRLVGIEIFSFKLWFIVPIGAALVGFLGASGAILAARYFNVRPTISDLVSMIAVAAGTMWLIYYLNYATFVLDDGRKVSDLVSFSDFTSLILTKTHMRVGRALHDTGEVGDMGYVLAAVEFLGFLIGGAATFTMILGFPVCAKCGTYLRKLKTKSTKDLTLEETDVLLKHFGKGELGTVQQVLAWQPNSRALDAKEQKAIIRFDLHGCPSCKAETVTAIPSAFNGKEWKEVTSLKVSRALAPGSSLRASF